jgi:hypothetical protein
METSIKYPRTHHLPWSDTIGPDGDHVLRDLNCFRGHEVVVTEKLDGENTTLYRTHLHARSLDGRHHPSRGWIKAFHARMCHLIPTGWRICGESLYALHSIHYQALPSYYVVFAVHDGERFLSWDDTERFCAALSSPLETDPGTIDPASTDPTQIGSNQITLPSDDRLLTTAPLLYRGLWNEKKIKACFSGRSAYGGAQEGYVVRRSDAFQEADFQSSVAKYVRPNHVQTDQHWMLKPVVKNLLVSRVHV